MKRITLMILSTVILFSTQSCNVKFPSEMEEIRKNVRIAFIIQDLRTNVIQIQMWLMDISATRGLDGFDDGFDAAHQHYMKAMRLIDDLTRKITEPQMKKSLSQLKQELPIYYETARKMASAYIEGGPEEGNKMMKKVDVVAERITEDLEGLLRVSFKTIDGGIKNY